MKPTNNSINRNGSPYQGVPRSALTTETGSLPPLREVPAFLQSIGTAWANQVKGRHDQDSINVVRNLLTSDKAFNIEAIQNIATESFRNAGGSFLEIYVMLMREQNLAQIVQTKLLEHAKLINGDFLGKIWEIDTATDHINAIRFYTYLDNCENLPLNDERKAMKNLLERTPSETKAGMYNLDDATLIAGALPDTASLSLQQSANQQNAQREERDAAFARQLQEEELGLQRQVLERERALAAITAQREEGAREQQRLAAQQAADEFAAISEEANFAAAFKIAQNEQEEALKQEEARNINDAALARFLQQQEERGGRSVAPQVVVSVQPQNNVSDMSYEDQLAAAMALSLDTPQAKASQQPIASNDSSPNPTSSRQAPPLPPRPPYSEASSSAPAGTARLPNASNQQEVESLKIRINLLSKINVIKLFLEVNQIECNGVSGIKVEERKGHQGFKVEIIAPDKDQSIQKKLSNVFNKEFAEHQPAKLREKEKFTISAEQLEGMKVDLLSSGKQLAAAAKIGVLEMQQAGSSRGGGR